MKPDRGLNHRDLGRKEAIELIRFLDQPMFSVHIKQRRAALGNFKAAGQVNALIAEARKLHGMIAEPDPAQYCGGELRPNVFAIVMLVLLAIATIQLSL